MSSITLKQAVELLHKNGDPIDVAATRIRRALEIGRVRGRATLIKTNTEDKVVSEDVDQEVTPTDWERCRRVDWEQSAAEGHRQTPPWVKTVCSWRYATHVVLNLDEFNREFCPQIPFLKTATILKGAAALPAEHPADTITLRKAVELLHQGGDSIDVAVIRIRKAAAARSVRSWGVLIGWDGSAPDGEFFESFDEVYNFYWTACDLVDWKHSTIEVPKSRQYDAETGCDYMFCSRIILSREDFDRVFFPDRADAETVVREQQPPMPLAEVKAILIKYYAGKPYPGVKEVERTAKQFDPRITRKMIEMAEPSVWPEGRPKPGRRTGTIMSRK